MCAFDRLGPAVSNRCDITFLCVINIKTVWEINTEMLDIILGIVAICLMTLSLLLILWDPHYKFPLLRILQFTSYAMWLSYALVTNSIMFIIGNGIGLGIITMHAVYECIRPRKTPYTAVPANSMS